MSNLLGIGVRNVEGFEIIELPSGRLARIESGMLRSVCFHCETLYLCGLIKIEDVKSPQNVLYDNPLNFKMKVCKEHYIEYRKELNGEAIL